MTLSPQLKFHEPRTRTMPPRIPQAYHRHAAPSGPWPWSDLIEDEPHHLPGIPHTETTLETASGPHKPWSRYPTSLFSNWTAKQVQRSGIGHILQEHGDPGCSIYGIDVTHSGEFFECTRNVVNDENQDEFWNMIQRERPDNIRIRALFVEDLSGPVLQMLGTKYTIEPFFFSSSLNWIPSRYQESITENCGDHVTVTLSFLRVIPNPTTVPMSPDTLTSHVGKGLQRAGTVTIDTQAPLILRSNQRMLLIDLMAIHLVRRPESSTLISYHPPPEWFTTSARYLHSRVRFAGQSVYWQSIFRQSPDPTFLLLSMLWYALYAWDESLENLYNHICFLESRVLKTYDIHLTRELHIIRASLLHYASLLESFRKTVIFVGSTQNTALRAHNDDAALKRSEDLMAREMNNLLSEIERLEMFRRMQDMRLENVMNLTFSSVNFDDSRDMQRLTKYSLRDSAVMKQISYLTMVFLPASFVASVFGMNVREIVDDTHGTLAHYFEVAIPLTAVTIWIILAVHHRIRRQDPSQPFWSGLGWPVKPFSRWLGRKSREEIKAAV
ncbi:hypothetical protein BD779DRAFT_1568105 [Infundibulicybe gibba]|nr:hypothetical protein BD779DRAFT_1568105 [Infundibulicybe gibba]